MLYAPAVLRDKGTVQARFVLGPAGTGKTFLCLGEIRQALRDHPEGPPLILLAPKQATFQLERQLLSDPALAGYTRLQILSFERLAKFILDRLGRPPPPLLSENGRGMVLHALLMQRRKELQIFHASAGLAGFSQQLSAELRELQRHRLSPRALLELAARPGMAGSLQRKLRDLAFLLESYLEWLEFHDVQDTDCLLDLAAQALPQNPPGPGFIDGLWLDGFAEMTPQELTLLGAFAPCCRQMTLAFCLDRGPAGMESSWLSIWAGISGTFQRCREKLAAVSGVEIVVEQLPRNQTNSRYAHCPALRHLEENWSQLRPFAGEAGASLRVAACDTPAVEAVLAAREILAFVRAGGRFREAAVLVRKLDDCCDELRRTFSRYQIPFFLDSRQPVAHHPLAELTRSCLRAAVRGWPHEDWFGALKSGLVVPDDEAIDQMENEALARGWQGELWFEPFRSGAEQSSRAESRRAAWIKPFAKFRQALSAAPHGRQLAKALRGLWRDLNVEEKLERWDAPVHATVWEQMNAWLDDLELAFGTEKMSLADWLPILETGLGGLSVGVIPPVMDQVLIGAVDRSRNPELKLAVLLGVNEKAFPAAPAPGGLLSDADREELRKYGTALGHDTREFLAREQFLGYIACTRSSHRLVVSLARCNAEGQPLNPSLFISSLKHLFPKLEIENYAPPGAHEAEYPCEVAAAQAQTDSPFSAAETLAPDLAAQLYGPTLRTSVSRIEQFAACAFRFFIHSGLRAEERKFFELDVRERGSFQHEALARFHQELQAEHKRWRDITPAEARARMGRIVRDMSPNFRDGLLTSSAQLRFSARVLARSLQEFVAAMVQWMSQYQFDPQEAEMGFGTGNGRLPAWELDLGEGHRLLFRGVIDRIDLCRTGGGSALAVVIDYKSGQRKLDKVLMAHGLQLQLAGYLSVLRHLPDPQPVFGAARLIPAGVFYVNLRGQFDSGKNRAEVLREREAVRQSRYQHLGRFDFTALPQLDSSGEAKGSQFKYSLKKDGQPHARNSDLLPPAEFKQMLDNVEAQLRRMGREIYRGAIGLNPYQKGGERACDKCDYRDICRFDPWTQPFRQLTAAPEEE